MGQALRGAAGRVRTSNVQTQTGQHLKNAGQRPPKGPAAEAPHVPPAAQDSLGDVPDPESLSKDRNVASVPEERDSSYDKMLNTMVGRITSKPGGKLEMGEAFIVERYNRPMPKLRSSKVEVNGKENPLPSGTLEAPQLRQILLLHEGKSEDHPGPMPIESIAKKFNIDPAQVKNIVRFISLPPEEKVNDKSESRTDI